ncbi:MAG: SPOR domain-containing protein [Balneolia bacterium]|nr:SPOR domain-containing protein [Balneolia bacterium]
MTISTEQLLKLISGMTDEKPDIVLKEWEELVDSVKKLEPGQAVEMSQLGTFKNEDGEITFEPNQALADEVNYEYTGQEPVVIEEGEEGSTTPIGMSVASDDDDEEQSETDDDDDIFGVGDADEKEVLDDEFVNPFARSGSEPLFPDVDKVSEKKEEAAAGDDVSETDDIFGLDEETESKEETPEPEETLSADKDDDAITPEKKPEEVKDEIFGTGKTEENEDESDRPLHESLESPDEDETKEDKSPAAIIPPVKPDEKIVEELKAEEEAAQAEAMVKKIEKEQEKREKAKQVKKFNVWVAPTKTKSRPNPQQVTKVVGGAFLAILVVGGLIWYVFSMLGSPDRPVAPQPTVVPAPVEQPVTEAPATPEDAQPTGTPAANDVPPQEATVPATEEVTPQDATEPAPADQTQEEAPAEQLPEPEEIAPEAQPEPEPEPETTPEPDPRPAPPVEPAQPLASGDYGLEGEIVNVPGRSYGIVVFSLSNLERAQQEEAALREMGYRTRVITIEQDDQTLHRVSVGQFETPEAAVEAGQSLPEPYRSSFFIRRFFP